ncbi:MAG: rod shape-determining protein MreC [Betaproteobacteria bacterium]|nr:rod shape-determining protein MreC [Betaproteobacteria bacterium]
MPLGTIDRSPPPFFKQGPSALSRLFVFSALAVFLMVADARLGVIDPLRSALATALYPLQWLALQPGRGLQALGRHFDSLDQAQAQAQAARKELAAQLLRAGQVEQLTQENQQLRQLLELRQRLGGPAQATEVIYQAADPYSYKVIIDKGMAAGVEVGSPVIDSAGVVGQVTRVHPLVSEVTLLIDRELTIPVLNTRTGLRSVAYGEPSEDGLELRFMAANTDLQEGDLLTTSGIDGIYPPGLPVARVTRIMRRAESAFARIYAQPIGQVSAARHLMVLKPLKSQLPPQPPAQEASPTGRKGGRP